MPNTTAEETLKYNDDCGCTLEVDMLMDVHIRLLNGISSLVRNDAQFISVKKDIFALTIVTLIPN